MSAQWSRIAALVGCVVAVPAIVGGCAVGSDVKGLAVQGNVKPAYLQSAIADVLIQQKVPILVRPVCTLTSGTGSSKTQSYSCSGKSTATVPIEATVTDATAESQPLTITVGGKQIFTGDVSQVIQNAAEGK